MANTPGITQVIINGAVGTGQSVGQTGGQGTNSNLNKPAYDFSSISPTNGPPSQSLDGPNPNAQSTILRFPGDTPPYYMMLPICKYSRASWASVGILTEEARIILPLPQQMIDNHNVRYAIEDIGFSGGAGFAAFNKDAPNALAAAAAAATSGAANQLIDKLGAVGGAARKAFNGSLTAAGVTVNDFMTVMLKGPDYKRRDFIWRFSPKSAQETSDLRRIIQLINNSMAPTFSATFGSAFFNWPKLWKPEFVYNGVPELLALNTFRMKPCVITDASFNYSPNGTFSPFARTKAPTSVEIHITFLELEFWLSGDFNDSGLNPDGSDPHSTALNLNVGSLFNGVGTPTVAP